MMIYILWGNDYSAKDAQISEFKKKFCPTPQAQQFDCDILSAHKLEAEILKKSLISLPSSSKKRLIVIRDCHKLSPQNKEIIVEFSRGINEHCQVVLEAETLSSDDAFIKKLGRQAKAASFTKKENNIFEDLLPAIEAGNQAESLKALSQLFLKGDHPLQIMGGLVWFWSKSRDRIMPERFQKGLTALKEADISIKRSRLKPEYALELLVAKLCAGK